MWNWLKDWWYSRTSVFNFSTGFGLSYIHLNAEVFDYGISGEVKLPYILERVNVIHWMTHALLRRIRKWSGNTFSYFYFLFGEHKALELQICPSAGIIGITCHETVHQDHWGFYFSVTFVGWEWVVHFYDGRHWYTEQNRPYLADEEKWCRQEME